VYSRSDSLLLSPVGFGTNVANEETIELFQGLLCSVCLGLFACDLAFAHNERVAFEADGCGCEDGSGGVPWARGGHRSRSFQRDLRRFAARCVPLWHLC